MERAARAFQKHTLSKPLLTQEDVLRAAWRAAVGKIISRHTSRVRLVRNTLVVEVEDAIWQRQLNSLWHQIVEQVRHTTGNHTIENVEFRIAVPRREAQRAQSASEMTVGSKETLGAPATHIPPVPAKQPPGRISAEALPDQPTLWSGQLEADESDRIQDAVLKKVYQLSRRKASA